MDSTTGLLFPVAAMTLMLWLIWSESLRARTMPRPWYAFRALLYVAMGAVLGYNAWKYGAGFERMNWVLIAVALVVACVGTVFFTMLAIRRPKKK